LGDLDLLAGAVNGLDPIEITLEWAKAAA